MVANKQALRRLLRGQRQCIPDSARQAHSVAACTRLLHALPAACRARVALYHAIGSELDCSSLHRALISEGGVTCYPRCVPSSLTLEFSEVKDSTELRPGLKNIPEPVDEHTLMPLQELTAIIVPGLAFTAQGMRLGYGAGYYDRTLADYQGLVVGVCFNAQVVDELPQEAHDIAMQVLVTQTSTFFVNPDRDPLLYAQKQEA